MTFAHAVVCITDLVPKAKGLTLFEQTANILQIAYNAAQFLLSIPASSKLRSYREFLLWLPSPNLLPMYLQKLLSIRRHMSRTLAHSKGCSGMLKPMADCLFQYSSICEFSICLVYRCFWGASFGEVLNLLQIQKGFASKGFCILTC